MIYEEPLLWEKGEGLTTGFSFPKSEVPNAIPNKKHIRESINLHGFSEPEVARHFTRLSTWNYGVDTDIYPLGSCTMKYNPKINEKMVSLTSFSNTHPLQGDSYSQGALEVLYNTGECLKEITGMDGVTLQPAAGAHGELVAIQMFKKYHKSKGNNSKNIILIPDSAHGTNPASAVLCGYKTRVVKSNEEGVLTPEAIKDVIDDSVAGIMITNPNTLGIFEHHIEEICQIVHNYGGLVYADGANLNALMGRIKMGDTGVDAMHVNLHKTFSTPHGGGGPGSGPVCVKKHLIDFLPVPRVVKKDRKFRLEKDYSNSIGRIHSFYGNFAVVLRAYCYILTLGADNLKTSSDFAVLNANYIRSKLSKYYNVPYNSNCLHEVLLNDSLQKDNNITTLDIAKGLIEEGIHPPTIYFPLVISGAMLIEPTESESKISLDKFIDKMIKIDNRVKSSPQELINAPNNSKRCRIDETIAARNPVLKGDY